MDSICSTELEYRVRGNNDVMINYIGYSLMSLGSTHIQIVCVIQSLSKLPRSQDFAIRDAPNSEWSPYVNCFFLMLNPPELVLVLTLCLSHAVTCSPSRIRPLFRRHRVTVASLTARLPHCVTCFPHEIAYREKSRLTHDTHRCQTPRCIEVERQAAAVDRAILPS